MTLIRKNKYRITYVPMKVIDTKPKTRNYETKNSKKYKHENNQPLISSSVFRPFLLKFGSISDRLESLEDRLK